MKIFIFSSERLEKECPYFCNKIIAIIVKIFSANVLERIPRFPSKLYRKESKVIFALVEQKKHYNTVLFYQLNSAIIGKYQNFESVQKIKNFFLHFFPQLGPPFLIVNYDFRFVFSDSKNPYKPSFVLLE